MSAAPTRGDELNDLIGPAFDKLAGGDYPALASRWGKAFLNIWKRRQGDPQTAAADAFELGSNRPRPSRCNGGIRINITKMLCGGPISPAMAAGQKWRGTKKRAIFAKGVNRWPTQRRPDTSS